MRPFHVLQKSLRKQWLKMLNKIHKIILKPQINMSRCFCAIVQENEAPKKEGIITENVDIFGKT